MPPFYVGMQSKAYWLIWDSLYAGIQPSKTSIDAVDLQVEDPKKALLKGGFYHGRLMNGKVYAPPRPLMNHGPHRCKWFFMSCLSM